MSLRPTLKGYGLQSLRENDQALQQMQLRTGRVPAGFEGFFADIETTARRFPYGSPKFFAEWRNVSR